MLYPGLALLRRTLVLTPPDFASSELTLIFDFETLVPGDEGLMFDELGFNWI